MWRNLMMGGLFICLIGLGIFGWKKTRDPGRFPFKDLVILGSVHTTKEQVLSKITLSRGDNLLLANPREIRDNLLTLPWVRQARVQRIFPSTLEVGLREKQPVFMSRVGEKLILMDEYGKSIKPFELGDPVILPIAIPASGTKDPNADLVNLMNLLGKHEWLRNRLSEAKGITSKRWALFTKKGIQILLSQNPEPELDLLRQLQKQYKILDREIERVDLRINGVAVVKPHS
ncbi:MAG: FtsQ-type POTRA domain-containing protein [Magnetococcus sp. DMHC-6]